MTHLRKADLRMSQSRTAAFVQLRNRSNSLKEEERWENHGGIWFFKSSAEMTRDDVVQKVMSLHHEIELHKICADDLSPGHGAS